jgi:hypothetical protein
MKYEEDEGNCEMRNFIICAVFRILLNDSAKEGMTGENKWKIDKNVNRITGTK